MINDLTKRLLEHADWCDANEWEIPITLGDDLRAAAARIVELIPSADVVPVVHGHWIFEEDGGTRCSVCGRKVKYKIEGMRIPIDLSHMPYCAGCGAKMDEEDNDG